MMGPFIPENGICLECHMILQATPGLDAILNAHGLTRRTALSCMCRCDIARAERPTANRRYREPYKE